MFGYFTPIKSDNCKVSESDPPPILIQTSSIRLGFEFFTVGLGFEFFTIGLGLDSFLRIGSDSDRIPAKLPSLGRIWVIALQIEKGN